MVLISATNCILNRITFHLFLGGLTRWRAGIKPSQAPDKAVVTNLHRKHQNITSPVWILWIALFDNLHINLQQYLHIESVDTSECAISAARWWGQEPGSWWPLDRSVCIVIKISAADWRLDHGAAGSCNAVNTCCRCASAGATRGEILRCLLVKRTQKGSFAGLPKKFHKNGQDYLVIKLSTNLDLDINDTCVSDNLLEMYYDVVIIIIIIKTN